LTVSTQSTKQIRSRGLERVVVVQVQLVYQRQRSGGASRLANGDGAVEGYDRRWGEREQLVVQDDDLRPVVCSSVVASACTASMSSIDLTVTSGIGPLRRRERSFVSFNSAARPN